MTRTYSSKKLKTGEGPNKSKLIELQNKPVVISHQQFCILSVNQPHMGLKIPYIAESSKKISPIFPGLKWNYKKYQIFIIFSLKNIPPFLDAVPKLDPENPRSLQLPSL